MAEEVNDNGEECELPSLITHSLHKIVIVVKRSDMKRVKP
jgi:hypothetical protein